MNFYGYARTVGAFAGRCLQLRDDVCRECERPVDGLFNICPHCGIAHPVKIPKCASLFIVGFTIHYVSMLVVQVVGS